MHINAGARNFLSLSRWLAACLVLLDHSRHLVFAEFNDVIHRTLLCKVFYFISGLGHEAVVIFFVLSGYLVGGLSLGKLRERQFDAEDYFIHRTARIFTVLLPALAVGAALDFVGSHYFNAAGLYTSPATYHIAPLDHPTIVGLNLQTFLGNVLMLQGSYALTFGSNGPLWSLANEWWYYVLFGLGAISLTTSSLIKRTFGFAGIVLLLTALPLKISLWLIVWALGSLTWWYAQSGLWTPPPAIGVGILCVAFAWSRLTHGDANPNGSLMFFLFRDIVLGSAFSLALASVLSANRKPILAKANDQLANFSYSQYVFHFPALLFLVSFAATFGQRFVLQPSPEATLYEVLIVTMLMAYAYAMSRVTEQYTPQVRTLLFHAYATVLARLRPA